MHGNGPSEDEPMAELNLIPLIDIALTLLIIMMLTSAFIKKPGVSLRLPSSVTREGAPEKTKDLVIAISRAGSFYLGENRQPSADAAVESALRRTAQANPDARVLLKGDRDVPYGRVLRAMDLARQAGLSRIILPTDPVPAR